MESGSFLRTVDVGSASEAFELLESAGGFGSGFSRPLKSQLRAGERELQVAVMRGFLKGSEVDTVHRLSQQSDVKEILDRDKSLVYVHNAYRVESQLKKDFTEFFDRLMQVAHGLDAQLWHAICPRDRLHPEIEYIVYDVAQMGRPGTIAPHCDNASKVSMVIMLSDTSEFEGGVSCFEGDSPEQPRMAKLECGDAVFFHGDACMHWITPVTSGRRVILQMELSSGHGRGWSVYLLWLAVALLFILMPAVTFMAAWDHASGTLRWQIWLLLPLVLLFEVWVAVTLRPSSSGSEEEDEDEDKVT